MSALGKITNNHSIRVLKDGVRILSSISSPIQIAVSKATREHVKGPPKEKHVRHLIAASSNRADCAEMIESIMIAIHENAWVRALKALQIIHRLIQEGSETFTAVLYSLNVEKLLNLSTFRDKTSGKGLENGPFIRSYAEYLAMRVTVAHSVPSLRQITRKLSTKTLCRDATITKPDSLFDIIKAGQKLLDSLLQCNVTDVMLRNSTTLSAFSLLLRDSFGIYKMLADCMILLIDFYFKFELPHAKQAFKLYTKHSQQTTQIIDLYDFTRRIPGIRSSSIPKLKSQPKSILEDMKTYIEKGAQPKEDESDTIGEDQLSEVIETENDTEHKHGMGSSIPDMFELGEFMDQDDGQPKSGSHDSGDFMSTTSSTTGPSGPVQGSNTRESFINNLSSVWDSLPQQGFHQNVQGPRAIAPPPYGMAPPPYSFAPPPYQSQFQPNLNGNNPFLTDDKNPPPTYTSNTSANPFDDPFEVGPAPESQQQQPKFTALDDFLGF